MAGDSWHSTAVRSPFRESSSRTYRELLHGALDIALHHAERAFGVFGLLCLGLLLLDRPRLLPVCRCRTDAPARPVAAGTRIEETEQIFAEVEAEIRRRFRAEELQIRSSTTSGCRVQRLNLAFSDSATVGNATAKS